MFEISTGRQTGKGIKTVLYGIEGIGKTTLASCFPDPIFIDTEGSTTYFDVQRFEPAPRSWTELKQMVDYVATTDFKTLVIDTFDWAEAAEIEELCAEQKGAKSIESIPYGKGYMMSVERIQDFLKSNLDPLIAKGINVVLVCHAGPMDFDDPTLDKAYKRWELKLKSKCKQGSASSVVKEWADMLLFCTYETYIEQSEKLGSQAKGKGGKTRVIFTEHDAAYDAKNRFGLKKKLPMDFESIAHIFRPAKQIEKPKAQEVKAAPEPTPEPKADPLAAPKPEIPYSVMEITTTNGFNAKDIQRMLFTLGVAKKLDCNLGEVPAAFWKSYVNDFFDKWEPLMAKAKQDNATDEPDLSVTDDDLPF